MGKKYSYFDERVENIMMTTCLCPMITICGVEIKVENYKKIFKAEEDEIVILFSRKFDELKICGKKLRVKKVNKCEIIIYGNINSLNYVNRLSDCT